MANTILFGKLAQEKILEGIQVLADATASTLGPRGRNVGIAKVGQNGEVFENIIVHDGVTVTKHVILDDPAANFGASILREAAQKQVQEAGDGTTLSIILSHAILTEAFKITAAGVNPMSLRAGLEDGVAQLITELDKISQPVETLEQKIQVATISAEDAELGRIVAETIDQMGVDGIVTCEESKSVQTEVEIQEGMQLDMGYSNQYFVTNPQTMEATLENARVLVTDKEINNLLGLEGLLTRFYQEGRSLLIIAPHFGVEAQELLITNKLQGKLKVLTIRAPSFGDNQKSLLNDIAIMTGAKMITSEAGHEFKDLKMEDLGITEYVSANKQTSILSGGGGKKEQIDARVEAIKEQIKEEDQDFLRAKLEERLAKLTNGVAMIKVGGQTEIEMKERRERVLDAIEATKAAIREGIVPGGETTFLSIREVLEGDDSAITILRNALLKPFEKLMANAGFDPGEMREALKKYSEEDGVDVTDGKIKNMIESGIIDPTAVLKGALRNALSVSVQLLTTGVVIVPIPEKK